MAPYKNCLGVSHPSDMFVIGQALLRSGRAKSMTNPYYPSRELPRRRL